MRDPRVPAGRPLALGTGRRLSGVRKRHRVAATGDRTRHPELALARWAAENLGPEERAEATVFTSGEHCPMCAAAHGWVGLGRIVYVHSSEQSAGWLADMSVPQPPVRTRPRSTAMSSRPPSREGEDGRGRRCRSRTASASCQRNHEQHWEPKPDGNSSRIGRGEWDRHCPLTPQPPREAAPARPGRSPVHRRGR